MQDPRTCYLVLDPIGIEQGIKTITLAYCIYYLRYATVQIKERDPYLSRSCYSCYVHNFFFLFSLFEQIEEELRSKDTNVRHSENKSSMNIKAQRMYWEKNLKRK